MAEYRRSPRALGQRRSPLSSFRSTGGGAVAGEPITIAPFYSDYQLQELVVNEIAPFSYVADLLLHGDGGEGSGAFVDSSTGAVSPGGKTVTANGGIVQRAAAAKFGTSGIRFDGVDDYLSLADDPAWDILAGGGDFFIEAWINPDTLPIFIIAAHYQDASNRWYWWVDGTSSGVVYFQVLSGGSLVLNLGSAAVVTAGAWQVLAVERWSGTVYLYRNGVVIASVASAISPTFTASLTIGSYPTGTPGGEYPFDGDMDEFVLRNGSGPRGQNYTPMASAYLL